MTTTTPDFRALCAKALHFLEPINTVGTLILTDEIKAALATTPPEPPPPYWPTKGEVIQLAMDTRLCRFQATAGDPIQYEMTEAQLIAFARAALERWGK